MCCCFLGDCSHYEIAQLPPPPNMSLLFSLHYQSIIILLNCFFYYYFDIKQVLIALILALLCLFLMVGFMKCLLCSCRVQNNSHVFIFFFSSHLFEFECCAFRARVVWLSTDRELCWIPFLSSCLTSVSWLRCRILREVISVPLPYADDFGWRSPI